MMTGAKRLRIGSPKPDKVHITTCIAKTLSLQKRQKLEDFEESLQEAFRFKNCVISKLKLENSDLKTNLKEMEESIANLKLEKEEINDAMKAKIEHFKTIYDEKFQLLQFDREKLIKNFKSKFAKRNEEDFANKNSLQEKDIERLMSKVKKWKLKYSSLNKRKRELAELNKEKDKIMSVKDKNCDDLSQIVQRYETTIKEKVIEIESLKAKVEECKLIFAKVNQINEIKKQSDKEAKSVIERNNILKKNNKDLDEKVHALKSENEDLIELNEVQDKKLCELKEQNGKLKEDIVRFMAKINEANHYLIMIQNYHHKPMQIKRT